LILRGRRRPSSSLKCRRESREWPSGGEDV
jgi:hypothetical protein